MEQKITVAQEATKNEQANEQCMSIYETLWHIQTEMEVNKTKPTNAKFSYFSVEDIMQEFHRLQKKYPCVLIMGTKWHFDAAGERMTSGVARLVNVWNPEEFVEVEGEVMPSFSSNIGSREQQTGSTNTYAKKSALTNLFGITTEQIDPDEMAQTPVTATRSTRTQKQNVVPPPKMQAPVQTKAAPQQAPAPVAQAPVQQAPVQTQTEVELPDKVIIVAVGDGKTLQVNTEPEPLVYPAFAEPMDPMTAMGVNWTMADPILGKYKGTVQSAMIEIFKGFDVAALHVLSNYIKDQTGENPTQLPDEQVQTLKAASAILTVTLSKSSVKKQA